MPTGDSTGRTIKQPVGFPTEDWGLNPNLGFAAYNTKAQKVHRLTASGKKQQGCSLPETDNWRHKGHLKSQHTNFHLQPLTQSSGKGGGKNGLEMPEERQWTDALRRELKVAAGIPGLSHPPDGSSILCAQADYSPLSGSSLRRNNSPNPRRVSVLALWHLILTAES